MRRLDAELVSRGLVRSRGEAQTAIDERRVKIDGMVALKAATGVSPQSNLIVEGDGDSYVSRGAHKLLGALNAFPISLSGRYVLDAGASTGGFTQVALEAGAAGVLAVDVGYGQIAWSLRTDPRVQVMERQNIRYLEPHQLAFVPQVVVADLSFISLTTVLPALTSLIDPKGEMLLMVKPQFEAGRDAVSASHGVVRDPEIRKSAVNRVAQAGISGGWNVSGIAASPLPGPKGNVEYFLWLTHRPQVQGMQLNPDTTDLASMIDIAIEEGPA
jgi:23S rRNA (cytidine1920-2'-O)/16S rRNA (cytidine1409-2'-O)-methyltransferase